MDSKYWSWKLRFFLVHNKEPTVKITIQNPEPQCLYISVYKKRVEDIDCFTYWTTEKCLHVLGWKVV